jgi:hypothetical protein
MKNVSSGFLRIYKGIHQHLSTRETAQKRVLLILGCQRSGTSLMYWILERDLNAKIFRESSNLSLYDEKKLRLDSLGSVQARIDEQKAPLVVLKPLVESQRAPTLLENLKDARILWLYRHYRDVAASNLKVFGLGNGVNDLRPIIKNQAGNWRAENVSGYTRSILAEHFSENMNPYEAAALFWFARNRLFHEQILASNRNVMLCKYEDLVTRPDEVMKGIYEFIGCPYPGDQITRNVYPRSIGKGNTVELSPEVDKICAALLEELDRAYANQGSGRERTGNNGGE